MRIIQLAREGSPPLGLRLPQAELSRKSNQIARGRIRRFESYMPSQAVQSLWGVSDADTGSNSPGELETMRNTSAVAACCSKASESSRVRRATVFRSASALRGLFPLRFFELRGAGSRSRGDPDVCFLPRLTMFARPVGEQDPGSDDRLHQLRPREREQLAYLICRRPGAGKVRTPP
jgi:hypothetical protein